MKNTSYPCVCGDCMQAIDREAALRALRDGAVYVHGCGRTLVKAK